MSQVPKPFESAEDYAQEVVTIASLMSPLATPEYLAEVRERALLYYERMCAEKKCDVDKVY